MKKILKKIFKFIKDLFDFLDFLLLLIYHRLFSNPIKEKYSGEVSVLANGPSLKEVIPKLSTEAFQHSDFVVMNFFAFEEVFYEIKPKYYCLADPMFIEDTPKKDQVMLLFKILQEKVDWELNIYLPNKGFYKNFLKYSSLSNSYLKYICLSGVEYKGFEKYRNFFYKKGLSTPKIQTVANMAIYVALNMGYSPIMLYGVEHTFLNSLCVNDKNQLCMKEVHFYDQNVVELKPMAENWQMAVYLRSISNMFASHDLLEQYARYLGVKIINCTKGSMIDSYERIK